MSTVKVKPLKSPAAPLSRSDLDRSLPWFRVLLGLVLITYSSVATIDGVRVDCGPLCAGPISGLPVVIPVWIVLGVLVAVLMSVAEWLTSDRYMTIYAVVLLADARYSQSWLDDWILPLVTYHTQGSPLAWAIGLVVSWGLAILVARFGEVLLFGRRTKKEDSDD